MLYCIRCLCVLFRTNAQSQCVRLCRLCAASGADDDDDSVTPARQRCFVITTLGIYKHIFLSCIVARVYLLPLFCICLSTYIYSTYMFSCESFALDYVSVACVVVVVVVLCVNFCALLAAYLIRGSAQFKSVACLVLVIVLHTQASRRAAQ